MTERLSPSQARKLVLLSQRLPPAKPVGPAIDATLSSIQHLGYIQIDTITAVERAHHHTLWNRNPRYRPSQLDELVKNRKVFEYWSHAAAYQPMCDFRHSLVMKKRIADGDQNHWYVRDERLMKSVQERITADGPLMAKDFENAGKKPGAWGSKPAKRALETLFMMGDLMIAGRRNFQKIYDLTERVLPAGTNTSMPTDNDHVRFLVFSFLRANGLGQPTEVSYLRKKMKSLVATTLKEMVADGEVQPIRVGEETYYALPDALDALNKPLSRAKLKILSPFDNLLIQRKRMQKLFGFDYLIECYLPEAKRRYGYFSLPILWNGKLVARMDCKSDRKQSTLNLLQLALEPSLDRYDDFLHALQKELIAFARFNGCNEIRLHRMSPASLKPSYAKAIKGLKS